ncbi:hypothetical protein F4777DRAFT_219693 [Nemania sp. FL0916]|nr:hypothetical protein F4777DRAFT_219693 [Nemania sp. FL0916]
MEPRDHHPSGPPPPYSETDIYSHSHGSHNERVGGFDDDESIAPSSSNSNVIYTPSESPRETQYGFPGPNNDTPATASARTYFDLRPPNGPPGPSITISLDVTPEAVSSDIPYPKQLHDRDVSEQDWQTFINYIIPGHAARENSRILAHKLRVANEGQPSTSDSIAEAQLSSLRSPPGASASAQSMDAVIREWNYGFFEPRGVTIRHTLSANSAREPRTLENETAQGKTVDAGQSQSQGQPQQPNSWWRNTFGFVDGSNGSLRIGPLHIEGDRVALGSTFEADRSGVRWRGQSITHPLFEAHSRGVRWGGQPHPGPAPPHPFGYRGGHPWAGPFGGGGPGRGRGGREHRGYRQRDRSRSADSLSSSSGSSSSSDSDSSIGSLPDWDHLKDTQLPITKRSVQAWLSHPDQPVTKSMLKQVKSEIKAAKAVPPVPYDPAWDKTREALRREVKELLQQFKSLKRQQRTAKRTARRERRQQKRAARKERRERRRSDKKDRRAIRRAEKDSERHARRHRQHHTANPIGPATFPAPSGPSAPRTFPVVPPFAGLFGRRSFGPQTPESSRPSVGRGSGGEHGCGPEQSWGQTQGVAELGGHTVAELESHATAELASDPIAEAMSNAERETARALATATQDREKALLMARQQREDAAQAAEESRRFAMAVAQHSRATASRAQEHALRVVAEQQRAAAAAAEEQQRLATDAVSRATVDSKLAQAEALESQISAKAAQVEALGVRIAEAEKQGHSSGEKSASAHGKKIEVDMRVYDSTAIKQLEAEMELLGRKVEALRVEADEEFARCLADKEDGWGGRK